MNFYNKINKYILERFPTMWNTHFIWMLLMCLLTHSLFWVLGYASLDIDVLKEYGIQNQFFKGGYFSFYVILGLLLLIYFSLRYFTHNPFKHFYPVSQWYFWKIFGQLFLVFLLFGSVFISFENGVKQKVKKIAPIESVSIDADKIMLAQPFLYNQISDYLITKRSYPEPFPCAEISGFVVGYDSINSYEKKHGIVTTKPYVFLNGTSYQFGKTTEKRIDSCKSETVLDSIFDVSKVYGLAEYSLYNYSGENINSNYRNYNAVEQEEKDELTKKIHKWYKTKDSAAIAKTIEDVKLVCKKYNISELLDAKKMASAGLQQDLNKQQLVRTGYVDYKNEDIENTAYINPVAVDDGKDYLNKTDITRKAEIKYNYYVDIPTFNTLQENVASIYDDMGTNQLYKQFLWAIIFASLCFALFFVMVKYIPLKDLIIGIFVAGVLATILSLYAAFTKYYRDENVLLGISIFYTAIIIFIGVYGIYSNAIKKHLLTKWFVALSISILAMVPMLLFFIREKTSSEIARRCSLFTETVYAYELSSWQFLVFGLVSVFIIFRLLRRLHAKVE